MKNFSSEQADFNRILGKIKSNPTVLLNPAFFVEFVALQNELFAVVEKVRKFQFPKSLFDKNYQAFLKDPFKNFREKLRKFEEDYL